MNIIQIGCSDGDDHVFKFLNETEEKCSVILIDAYKPALLLAEERYKKCDNHDFVFLNLAVVDSQESEVLFFSPDCDKIHGCNSLSEDFLIMHGHRRENLKSEKVKSKNINDILKDSKMSKIDKLFIDAEGLDCSLISAINFSSFNIESIVFEFAHSEGARSGVNTKTFQKMQKILNKEGFALSKHSSDDWNLEAKRV